MIVKTSEFIISAAGNHQLPTDGLPEVALAGRSNVGKSSLINRMLLRKNLARTSAQPGKTQTLNYYLINGELYFVDFPGYGYARVSKSQRDEWGRLIEQYLRNRSQLKLVLLLVDLRHPPTELDRSMYDWLSHYGIPMCVVATKADKLSRNQVPKHLKIVRETLGMPKHESVIAFSSVTGQGRDECWQTIEQSCEMSRISLSEPDKRPQETEDRA